MIDGARRLLMHYLTLYVPWYDDGWRGTVCKDPRANTTWLVGMPRIAEETDGDAEHIVRRRALNVLNEEDHPVCVAELRSPGRYAPALIDRVLA